jgi:CRISPR-associated protein Csb2
MLAIELTLLTGRYVATTYNDRRRAEWPPHPARLFSALVATHFSDESPTADERAVLEWLERLGPPDISASEANEREVVTVFVPVNDNFVVKSFDRDFDELETDRQEISKIETKLEHGPLDAAEKKALEKEKKALEKSISKTTERLSTQIQKEIAVPPTPSKSAVLEASKVLPDFRNRQPRTFPSVTPADPRVTFTWREASPSPEQRILLDRLLARLVRLGHSSSLVSARLIEESRPADYIPSETGTERIRTPRPGQVAALEAQFALHRETEPRVIPARFETYGRQRPTPVPSTVETSFSREWLILRRADGPALPMTSSPGVARTLRRALMSAFGDRPVPEALSGHRPDGSPSQNDHLAIIPLPFIGHTHASGNLLGIALAFPKSCTGNDRRVIFRALAELEDRARTLPENADLVGGEIPLVPLYLGDPGTLFVERVEGLPKLTNLQPETWCRPARTWISATPVALDRNPGDLRSRDSEKLQRALEEARQSLQKACVRIGLPTPAHIEILPAAPWAGAAKARHYGSVTIGQTVRILTHVRLTFDQPVAGPVLIGAGRYLGLGLFRPEPTHE